jgi:hypothetical protein
MANKIAEVLFDNMKYLHLINWNISHQKELNQIMVSIIVFLFMLMLYYLFFMMFPTFYHYFLYISFFYQKIMSIEICVNYQKLLLMFYFTIIVNMQVFF